jgi:signal peptidase II
LDFLFTRQFRENEYGGHQSIHQLPKLVFSAWFCSFDTVNAAIQQRIIEQSSARFMKTQSAFRTILILMILVFNVGCDQISKVIVRNNISRQDQIEVIPEYFTLLHTENTGAFLSFGDSMPKFIRVIIFMILPIVVLGIALGFVLKKNELSTVTQLGICFVISGGFGNIIDRVFLGSVTDFMHMDFVLFQTGIFNIADVAITFGTIMIVGAMLFDRKKADDSVDTPVSES